GQAVPTTSHQVAESTIPGIAFRKPNAEPLPDAEGRSYRGRRGRGESLPMSFYEPATISYKHRISQAGTYKLIFDIFIRGEFIFDPGRVKFTIKVGDKEALTRPFGWEPGKRHLVEI